MNDKKKGTPRFNKEVRLRKEAEERNLRLKQLYDTERHFNRGLQKENTRLLLRLNAKSFIMGFIAAAILCGTAFAIYWFKLVA